MIVVDASVAVAALVDGGRLGDAAAARMSGEELIAPEHLVVEGLSAIRGLLHGRRISRAAGDRAAQALVRFPIELVPLRPVAHRVWQLRDHLTTYDAAYLALAELVGARLVTADARLAEVPGVRCPVEVIR